MDKAARLLDLARKRQASRWPGYKPLVEYRHGAYECDFVSPYTKAAGNVDAAVMILLQDWSSDDELSGELDSGAAELGFTPTLPTNKNLIRLLKTHFGLQLRDTYATNIFPFIKPGKLSATIRVRDLERAALEFAIPQIDIVIPRLVVCLGLKTFNALRRALGMGVEEPLDRAIGAPFSRGLARVWCQAHTGTMGQNNRHRLGINRVSQDWLAMQIDARLP
ncbi:MAG: hypothetical protein ABI665_26625 [Vicinamibacterales bacterium]